MIVDRSEGHGPRQIDVTETSIRKTISAKCLRSS